MSKQNVGLVKEINLNIIRDTMRRVKVATKPQLAELTGISVVTINSLTQILLRSGEILESQIVQPEVGRPAVSFQFNENHRLALIIYLHEKEGVDTGFFTVINLYGEPVKKVEKNMTQVAIDSFDSVIQELIMEYSNIELISFGMPGVEVNSSLMIMDYEGLLNTKLVSYIKEQFHIPVTFENDINAATAGYCYQQGITKEQCVIGLYFPEKYLPGAGIYLHGDIYKGRNGLAGEVKYLPFYEEWVNQDYLQLNNENKNEEKVELIVKTIMSFMCMYNPDTIVLYGEKMDDSIIRMLHFKCNTQIQQIMIPHITIENNINSDFEIGVIQMALRQIQPSTRIES